jgi:sporulation protein YlmC with PRC-barrel domain
MYLTFEEMRDSPIINSEGLIEGYVENIILDNGQLSLSVYKLKSSSRKIVDREALEAILLDKTVKKTFGSKTIQDLYKKIRPGSDTIKLDDLIEYSNLNNIQVPTKELPSSEKEYFPPISWDMITGISKTTQGKCVMLRETNSKEEIAPFIFNVIDKLIIDSAGQIIGVAKEIVFGTDGPALAVKRRIEVEERSADFESLKDLLMKSYGNEDYMRKTVSEELGYPKDQLATDEMITGWAENKGYQIPLIVKTRIVERPYSAAIPWRNIRRIGDVILLSKKVQVEEIAE